MDPWVFLGAGPDLPKSLDDCPQSGDVAGGRGGHEGVKELVPGLRRDVSSWPAGAPMMPRRSGCRHSGRWPREVRGLTKHLGQTDNGTRGGPVVALWRLWLARGQCGGGSASRHLIHAFAQTKSVDQLHQRGRIPLLGSRRRKQPSFGPTVDPQRLSTSRGRKIAAAIGVGSPFFSDGGAIYDVTAASLHGTAQPASHAPVSPTDNSIVRVSLLPTPPRRSSPRTEPRIAYPTQGTSRTTSSRTSLGASV